MTLPTRFVFYGKISFLVKNKYKERSIINVSFQKSGAAEPGRVIQVEEKVLFSGRNWLGRKSRCFEQMVAKRT